MIYNLLSSAIICLALLAEGKILICLFSHFNVYEAFPLSIWLKSYVCLYLVKELAKKRDALIRSLPPEPPAEATDVIRIMFKLPDGSRCERRFNKTDKLKVNN